VLANPGTALDGATVAIAPAEANPDTAVTTRTVRTFAKRTNSIIADLLIASQSRVSHTRTAPRCPAPYSAIGQSPIFPDRVLPPTIDSGIVDSLGGITPLCSERSHRADATPQLDEHPSHQHPDPLPTRVLSASAVFVEAVPLRFPNGS